MEDHKELVNLYINMEKSYNKDCRMQEITKKYLELKNIELSELYVNIDWDSFFTHYNIAQMEVLEYIKANH